MPNPTPGPRPTTSGPINKVPCPACGAAKNFSGADETLQPGYDFKCGKCGCVMEIQAVKTVKMVWVRRVGQAGAQQPQQRQVQQRPGLMQRLLKK